MEMVVIYTRDKNGIWEKIQKGLYRLLVENPKFAHLDVSLLEMVKEIPEIVEEIPQTLSDPVVPDGFYEEELQKPEFNIEDYI